MQPAQYSRYSTRRRTTEVGLGHATLASDSAHALKNDYCTFVLLRPGTFKAPDVSILDDI